jgi:hypothetical protein
VRVEQCHPTAVPGDLQWTAVTGELAVHPAEDPTKGRCPVANDRSIDAETFHLSMIPHSPEGVLHGLTAPESRHDRMGLERRSAYASVGLTHFEASI